MRFRDARDLYIHSKKAMGMTEDTIRDYESSIRNFCRFAVDKGIFDIDEVTPALLEEYLIYKREGKRKNSPQTVFAAYRDMRAWFRWLFKKKYISSCPINDVDTPRKGRQEARVFTPKEIDIIFKSFDKQSFFGYRDYGEERNVNHIAVSGVSVTRGGRFMSETRVLFAAIILFVYIFGWCVVEAVIDSTYEWKRVFRRLK